MRKITLAAEQRKDSRRASRRETQGALGETEERVCGDMDRSCGSEGRKKGTDSVCNLDIELADWLGLQCEQKKVKGDPSAFNLDD